MYSKRDFAMTFQSIGSNALGFKNFKPDQTYSNLESFIRDRDYPMTEIECICVFKAVTGKWPSKDQIAVMRPDSDDATEDYRNELIADYNSIYG